MSADEDITPEAIATSAEEMARRAMQRVRELDAGIDQLQEQVDGLAAENDELRSEIERLEQRTGLMEAIADASTMQIETRAAVCVQTLVNEASSTRGEDLPTASMDWHGGQKALGGSISRTSVYDTFEKAEQLVNDRLGEEQSVVKFKRESRSSDRNSRLVVDLESGDVPGKIGGENIRNGRDAT